MDRDATLLDEQLRNCPESVQASLDILARAWRFLRELDEGRVNGRCIAASERDETYQAIHASARAAFARFYQREPDYALHWLENIPRWSVPRRVDRYEWEKEATGTTRMEQHIASLGQCRELPLLLVGDETVLPWVILDREARDARSLAAVRSAVCREPALIAVVSPRRERAGRLRLRDLRSIGCAAAVLHVEQRAEEHYCVGLLGLTRIRVNGVGSASGHSTISFSMVDDRASRAWLWRYMSARQVEEPARVTALAEELRAIMRELDACTKLSSRHGHPGFDSYDAIGDPGRLADICADQLSDSKNQTEIQSILQTTSVPARLKRVLRMARARQTAR